MYGKLSADLRDLYFNLTISISCYFMLVPILQFSRRYFFIFSVPQLTAVAASHSVNFNFISKANRNYGK